MRRQYFFLIGMLLTAISTLAQDYKQFQSMYKNALKLYTQKDTLKAIEELEKIIQLKPNFTDAIYDLGVIHYQAGNIERAIALFQTAVRQGDRKAAELLKEELKQKIAYNDTMLIDDVDVKPYVLVNSKKQEMKDGPNLNKNILRPLLYHLKKSKVLEKEIPAKSRLILNLMVNKKGNWMLLL